MLMDANSILRVPVPPAVLRYPGASADFTQIWQDLITGQYLTNILYDGEGVPSGTDFDKSVILCARVDSGDGAGKWRLPSGAELCGPGYASGSCDGGFYAHELKNVTFAGDDWAGHFWSSSLVVTDPSGAWIPNLFDGSDHYMNKTGTSAKVLCVR